MVNDDDDDKERGERLSRRVDAMERREEHGITPAQADEFRKEARLLHASGAAANALNPMVKHLSGLLPLDTSPNPGGSLIFAYLSSAMEPWEAELLSELDVLMRSSPCVGVLCDYCVTYLGE